MLPAARLLREHIAAGGAGGGYDCGSPFMQVRRYATKTRRLRRRRGLTRASANAAPRADASSSPFPTVLPTGRRRVEPLRRAWRLKG